MCRTRRGRFWRTDKIRVEIEKWSDSLPTYHTSCPDRVARSPQNNFPFTGHVFSRATPFSPIDKRSLKSQNDRAV